MQNFRNYYQILGVSRDASLDEIKKVYRRLARQFHPDLNPGDKSAEEKFKEIGEAYDVLSDPSRRAQYDQFSNYWGKSGFRGRTNTRPAKTWGDSLRDLGNRNRSTEENVDFAQYPDFNKFIDLLLNRRREERSTAPIGARARIRDNSYDTYRPGNSKTAYTIPARSSRRDIEAQLTLPLEKAYTGGQERIRLEDGRSLEVDMPPGIVSGQRIRLRSQGIGGGDLYLKITVARHPFFQLEGIDIYCQLPLTPSEAIVGGQIEIPTLDGLVKMRVPPRVVAGQRLRLANKGYLSENGDRGDQIVEIQIATPKDPSPPEIELYEKLRQIESFNPRSALL
ncbi:MAG: J domain-containing protein [Desertifilum sp. SIO1I2]|nr:J domain-containing protein [Desertifilum sp. SIO1I2]